jgi:O-methyltransferase involved in polyketide biosynthesis
MLVLTEGVVPYLDLTQAGALAQDLRATPGLVGWIVDYISPETHRYRDKRVGRNLKNAPFKFRPDDWFEFFAEHGFKPRSIRYLADEGRRVGRPAPLPWTARLLMRVIGKLGSTERRDGFRKFSGYVWLEPGQIC